MDAIIRPSKPDDTRVGADMSGGSAPSPDARTTVHTIESPHARSLALVVIAVILVFGALYVAQAFFIPVALALVFSFFLSPVVRFLARYHLPPPVGAALVLLAATTAVIFAGYALAPPVREWVADAPATLAKATRKLRVLSKPVEQVTKAADQVERAGTVGEPARADVVIRGPSLVSKVFGTTEALLAGALEALLLLYSLLAVGDLFLQKLVDMLPRRGDREKAVSIARTTEAAISSYLFLTALINLGEGVVVAGAMAALGMPAPVLWGAFVAVAEFVPYLGMLATLAMLTVVSVTTFDSVARALLVPAAFIAINFVQGNVVTPLVMGRRLQLNPVAIFLALALSWWMWGVAGVLLAVPLLAIFKILCDHVESLASIGAFLGERDSAERRSVVRARQLTAAARRRMRPSAAAE